MMADRVALAGFSEKLLEVEWNLERCYENIHKSEVGGILRWTNRPQRSCIPILSASSSSARSTPARSSQRDHR